MLIIRRVWMELSHGEKMSALKLAEWETKQRWNMKKAAMAGS